MGDAKYCPISNREIDQMIKFVRVSARVRVVAAFAGCLLLISGAVLAHGIVTNGAVNNSVEIRKAAMKNLGINMKAIAAVAKGEAEYSDALNRKAQLIAEIAGTITILFHDKVIIEDSRAKPEIWTNMDDFKLKAEALVRSADGLIAAVKAGDQGKIGAALAAAGKSCGGCHKPYRLPKK